MVTLLGLLAMACAGGDGARNGSQGAAGEPTRTDVPEPAVAGEPEGPIPGTVVPLAGMPEGLAFDATTGVLAVAVRDPGGVVLVDGSTGAERARISLPGAARHLALAGPGGPVLVPTENNDRLYRVALADGAVVGDSAVGRQPHDVAVAAGGTVFVGDELADTLHILAPDGSTQVVPAPVQPGGVASSEDGSTVVAVGVRGRRIEAFGADGRSLGSAPCGVGPTHVEAGPGGLFYVADTQGGAILVYRVGPEGPRQVGRTSTDGGAPYGLAVDVAREKVYVSLTASNQLRSFGIEGASLEAERTWQTVRQPNDVAVDPSTGRVVVAGSANGQLQLLDPAAN